MRSKNLVTFVVAFIMASSMFGCARNIASSSVSRTENGDFSSTTKSIGAQNKRAESNINAANEEMGSLSVSSGAANNVNATNGGFGSMTKSIGGQNSQAESNINTTNEEMPSSSISNGGFGSMTKSLGGQNNQALSNINAANVEMASLSLSSRAANNINATNVRSSDFGSMTKSLGGQNKQVQSNAETSDQASCKSMTPIILTTSNQKIRGFVLEDEHWSCP